MGKIKIDAKKVILNLSKTVDVFHEKYLKNKRNIDVPSVSEFKTMLESRTSKFANENQRDALLQIANDLTAKLTSHDIMKRKRLLYMWHELFRKVEREIQAQKSKSKRKIHVKRGENLYPYGFLSEKSSNERKTAKGERPITALIQRQVDRDAMWSAHDDVGKELYAAEYDLAFRSHHRPETSRRLEDTYAVAMMRKHRPGTATVMRNINELTDFSLGRTEISAIGRALTSYSKDVPSELLLSGNRIDSVCMKDLSSGIRQCSSSLRHLNLSNNKIGIEGVKRLADVLSDKDCVLEILNVSNNSLDDTACAALCKATTRTSQLKDLNLSKNSVGKDTMTELSRQIKSKEFHLEHLSLSWTGCGGRDLTLFLKSTSRVENTLQDLDLSWNSLSKSNMKAIRNVLLAEKSSLQHLNLSYTQLSRDEIKKLSRVLMKNKRLVGLHVEGTQGCMDAKGCLSVRDKITVLSSTKDIMSSSNKDKKSRAPSCWICQKWVPQDFQFETENEEEIFIHLNIDDWRPDKMIKHERENMFRIRRYVPPDFRVEYYFSDSRGNRRIDSNQSLVISENDRNTFPNREDMIGVVNTIRSMVSSGVVVTDVKDKEMCLRMPWVTRNVKLLWSPAASNFQNRAFTSSSRDYVDTTKMWRCVQDKDWSRLKERVRFLRTVQAFDGTGGILPIRDVLRDRFGLLRACFIHTACHLNTLRVGKGQFLDLMQQSNILNTSRYCKKRQLEDAFRFATEEREENNNMKRFEFVEACVRVSILRYVKGNGKGNISVSSAFEKLIKEHLAPCLQRTRWGRFAMQNFNTSREKILYTDAVDTVLNRHMVFLEILFEEICKKRSGQMSCKEFTQDFCRAFNLFHRYDDHTLRLIFAMSRLETRQRDWMTLEDFLEALLRLGVTTHDDISTTTMSTNSSTKKKKKVMLPRRQTIATTSTTRRSSQNRRRTSTSTKRRKNQQQYSVSSRLALPVEYNYKGVMILDGTNKTCGMKTLIENENFQHSLRSLEIGLDLSCDVEESSRLAPPVCICSLGNQANFSYFSVTIHQGGTSLRTSLRLCDSEKVITIRSERPRDFFSRSKRHRIEIIWNGRNVFQYVDGELDARGNAVGILSLSKTTPPPERKIDDDSIPKSLADYGKVDKEEPLESKEQQSNRVLSSGGNLSIGYERFDKYVRGRLSGTLSKISVAVSEFPPRNIPVDNSVSARFDRFLSDLRKKLPEDLRSRVLSRVTRHSKRKVRMEYRFGSYLKSPVGLGDSMVVV